MNTPSQFLEEIRAIEVTVMVTRIPKGLAWENNFVEKVNCQATFNIRQTSTISITIETTSIQIIMVEQGEDDDFILNADSAAAQDHRAKYASLNRARPTDFMGGSQISFRDRPPAPIKIESNAFLNNPFLKDRRTANKNTAPK